MSFPVGPLAGAPLSIPAVRTTARVAAVDTALVLTPADSGAVLRLNPAAAPLAQTLPTIDAGTVGATYTVVNVDAVNAVDVTSANTFNGAAGPVAVAAGASATFVALDLGGLTFDYAVLA